MEIVVNKKKYKLHFGMICWEVFQAKAIEHNEAKKKIYRVTSLCDVIQGAIENANEIDGLNQKVSDKDLKTWVDTVGITEEGLKTLNEIEGKFMEMQQYKVYLNIIDKKKLPTP